MMHVLHFSQLIQHAENLGGEIDKSSNKIGIIEVFPFKFQERRGRLRETSGLHVGMWIVRR